MAGKRLTTDRGNHWGTAFHANSVKRPVSLIR